MTRDRRRHPECVGGAPVGSIQYESCHWRERRLKAGIRMAITALDVPSAEYVPAIADAVALLVTALRDVEQPTALREVEDT